MIIITGASRGIGKYLFETYNKQSNDTVIGTYHSSKPLQINNFFHVNISDYKSVQEFYCNIKSELNNITLINCAGISYNIFAHKSDPVKWKNVIDVNLVGTYHVIRTFLPLMRQQNFGRIINLSSVVAQKNTPGVSAYAASKAALWGLTKSLCAENGSKNITINNINLGYVSIGMGVEKVPEDYQILIKEQIPSKEFCKPTNILNAVEFLRNTPYMNGTSIDLNGGLI